MQPAEYKPQSQLPKFILNYNQIMAYVDSAFTRFDRDKSHYLEKSQVQDCINKFFEENLDTRRLSPAQTQQLINKYDINHDQKIGTGELLKIITHTRNQIAKKFDQQFSDDAIFQHVDEAFAKYDKDNKNELDCLQVFSFVREYFKQLHLVNPYEKKTIGDLQKIFASYDMNHNDKLSRMELRALIMKMKEKIYSGASFS